MSDFYLTYHGSLSILTPQTPQAREWREEYLPADAQTWGHGGVVIEHRFVQDIVDGIREAGLTIGP